MFKTVLHHVCEQSSVLNATRVRHSHGSCPEEHNATLRTSLVPPKGDFMRFKLHTNRFFTVFNMQNPRKKEIITAISATEGKK